MNKSAAAKTKKITGVTPWSPFRYPAFSVLWVATVVSNIGTWMNDVGAGWLMTSLAPTPLMVSMVQAATTLPMFLFALPAGALADIFDRRKILIIVTAVMVLTAAPMGMVVLNNAMTPTGLLLFTFALGSGAAFIAPIWQAIIPGLVAKETLQPAVVLNSVGINISRAIGPAFGGIVIVLFGIAWPFLLNAASFLAVIIALIWWRPEKQSARYFPREQFLSAIQTGLRYTRSSPAFKTALARTIAFFPFASAYWGLLPLIVRQELGGGPELYGLLLGSVGVGGVAGAFLLSVLKPKIGTDNVVVAGSISMVLVIIIFAFTRQPAIAIFASVLAGISWIAVLSCLNVSAQTALPEWVRARGLSVFITVFFGCMTVGSIVWGQVATIYGIPAALLGAAMVGIAGLVASKSFRLQQNISPNLDPSMHWPEPVLEKQIEADRGPVMITVKYHIDRKDTADFLNLLYQLADARRRDGAYAWGVFEDAANPECYLEYFLEVSWLEHLRHHQRVTEQDRILQEEIQKLHLGTTPPKLTHFLTPDFDIKKSRRKNINERGLK